MLIWTVLLLTHYHMGSLILADTIDTLSSVPGVLTDSTSLRLQACNAVVNVLTLAMSYDRYSDDESPYRSRFLRDPTPELMVEVLSRAGKAILSMFHGQKIQASTSQIMLSVILSALTILSSISHTASYTLSSLIRLSSLGNLKITLDSQSSNKEPVAKPEQVQFLSGCDSDVVDEFLQETQIQASLDNLHLENTIAKYEQIRQRSTSMTGETANMGDLSASNFSTLQATVSSNFQANINMANWTQSPDQSSGTAVY